jgi:hypothetical protein
MADAESTARVGDLEVDTTAADSVRGGMTLRQRQAEITRLKKAGWIGSECTPEGDVYFNPKTHKTKIVPYVR